jgi:hypothetical protein
MGKRSDFERIERDFYPTPPEAIYPLTPWISTIEGFCEPCVGSGALSDVLVGLGHHLALACDPEPSGEAAGYARRISALEITQADCRGFSHFITNPPWPRKHGRGEPTLSMIRHLSSLRPTLMLLSADFAHNTYATEVLDYCPLIISIGRIRWIAGSEHTGKDNAAWYLFNQRIPIKGKTIFVPRQKVIRPMYVHEIEELI